MSKYIMKVQGRDLYVEWSTVDDDATYWGTYNEMLKYMVQDAMMYIMHPEYIRDEQDYQDYKKQRRQEIASAERILARIREYGTSSLYPNPPYIGAYEVEFINTHSGKLPRHLLGEYMDYLIQDDEFGALRLLEPYDD